MYHRYMEDEAGPSLPTADQEPLQEVIPQSVNNDVPEVAVPHEILQDVGAQNIFTAIEVPKLAGMALIPPNPRKRIIGKINAY